MSNHRVNRVIAVATISLLAILIYRNRSYLKKTWIYLISSTETQAQFEHIELIEKALLFVHKSLMELKNIMADMPNDEQILNLKKLSSEMDYIFAEIDSISGDDYVKELRRDLVNTAHILSEHLDQLLKSSK